MIINLSAGDNTSEEVEVLLTELETEINTLMTELKSDVANTIAQLTDTINNLPLGAVKSIQRGEHNSKDSNSSISINPVNPDKCIVLLSSPYIYSNGTYLPRLVSISENEFTITRHQEVISWQVIEFY